MVATDVLYDHNACRKPHLSRIAYAIVRIYKYSVVAKMIIETA